MAEGLSSDCGSGDRGSGDRRAEAVGVGV
jgi:hypothetical protein